MDYLGEVICLSLDSIIFGICLKSYIRNKNAIQSIEDAPQFQVNAKLEDAVEKNNGHLPYVAIRGNVKALSPAIWSINKPFTTGVIQRLTIKEHVASRTSSGFWIENNQTISEVYNSIPFALTSKGEKVEVEVVDALCAAMLDLEVISDTFIPSKLGFLDHIWSFFTSVRKRGLQTVEEILKEGSFVTAVGEVNGDRGSLRIQPPNDGSLYFVTTTPLHSLVRKLEVKVSYYGWFCIGFGLVGVVLCGSLVRKYWKRHKEWLKKEAERKRLESSRKERRRKVRDAEESPAEKICVVCKINPREIILLPCGHVCLCEDCNELIADTCPVCKASITGRNPVFIA